MLFIKKFAMPLVALLLVTACQTSGRTYAEMEKANAFPPLADDKGRVFLYRYSTLGAAVQPVIRVDGDEDKNIIGRSVPEGFFYVDLPAGQHRFTTDTEVEKSVQLLLNQKETVYIKQTAVIGFLVGRIKLGIAGEAQAKEDMKDLHYQYDKADKK